MAVCVGEHHVEFMAMDCYEEILLVMDEGNDFTTIAGASNNRDMLFLWYYWTNSIINVLSTSLPPRQTP